MCAYADMPGRVSKEKQSKRFTSSSCWTDLLHQPRRSFWAKLSK